MDNVLSYLYMSSEKKILIIEDEPSIAEALRVKLLQEGHDVQVAFNGNEGVTMAGTGSFDLILLDLVMPGKDGITVLKDLKDANVTTRVVVTSNLSKEETKNYTLELGAVAFIVKSDTTLEEMMNTVKQFLDQTGDV